MAAGIGIKINFCQLAPGGEQLSGRGGERALQRAKRCANETCIDK